MSYYHPQSFHSTLMVLWYTCAVIFVSLLIYMWVCLFVCGKTARWMRFVVVSHLGLVWVLELELEILGWLLCASGIFVRAGARAAHRAEGTRNDINQGCLPVNGRCGPLMLCPLAHDVGSRPRIRAFIIVAVGRGPPPHLPRPSADSCQTKGSLTNRLRFVDWLS